MQPISITSARSLPPSKEIRLPQIILRAMFFKNIENMTWA